MGYALCGDPAVISLKLEIFALRPLRIHWGHVKSFRCHFSDVTLTPNA